MEKKKEKKGGGGEWLPDSGGVMSDGTRLVTEDDLEQQLEVLHLDG